VTIQANPLRLPCQPNVGSHLSPLALASKAGLAAEVPEVPQAMVFRWTAMLGLVTSGGVRPLAAATYHGKLSKSTGPLGHASENSSTIAHIGTITFPCG
jgi:hypothetical protein